MKRPSFQDYLDELSCGHDYGIFVDDTGSPGLETTPANLHPDRKSWVAVVVRPDVMPEVLSQLPGALDGLKEHIGADEFHFADIWAGRGKFKHAKLEARLNLFRFMAHIFSIYRFPIIVQTFDPTTLADLRSKLAPDLPDRISMFNLRRQEDAALLILMIRLKSFMEQTATYPNVKARVFIDEGYKRNGIGINLPTFDTVFADGLICFCKSCSILPIQLADFAAFSLNKMQLIASKETRNDLDIEMLEIFSSFTLNYQNIEKRVVSPAKDGPLF